MTGVATMACSHGFVSQPGMAILASASNVMTNVGMVRISAMASRLPRWLAGRLAGWLADCPSTSAVDSSTSAVTLPFAVGSPSAALEESAPNPPSARNEIVRCASKLGNSRSSAQVATAAATIDTVAKNRSNLIMSLNAFPVPSACGGPQGSAGARFLVVPCVADFLSA